MAISTNDQIRDCHAAERHRQLAMTINNGMLIYTPTGTSLFLTNDNAKANGINENTPATMDITVYPAASKIKPLLKLINAEARPTRRSFVPCVRDRSTGES